ncbi:hypothetical protein AQUCO_00400412v1 [Aquilegia coerulea]|uniref:N-acetyltransferase domain-containing protein n=1 Tax=Aquilegia coerulea TaxID=218851 RepID=A0A2G5EUV9_AQUCA|nr:hypothetical protein AQUCO_00400412v1 [Aquilegia coerulea]
MTLEEIKIRTYDRRIDRHRVEDLEQRCEVGPAESSATLIVDTMGDPTCRIRHCQIYKMLVAELNNKELVGMVQGTIKIVTVHLQHQSQSIVGYILGLRVSPLHRQRGIALSLVKKMEEWFILNHVDLAYMATDKDNEASVKLFTEKLQYVKFRTPSILVNPVSHHLMRLSPSVKIVKLKIEHAERLYRRFMGSTEFFPQDIDRILKNKLSLGTWIAYWQGDSCRTFDLDQYFPTSWAMLSIWNSGQQFKLRVGKPSLACQMYARSSSFIDRFFPCFKFPFIPDMFKPFGFYFMYGLYQEGPKSGSLMQSLCKLVHNMATKCQDCKVVVTETGGYDDMLRHHIPHRKLLSCPEDLWCIKDLKSEEKHLTRTPHPRALFIDPREV